MLGIGESENGNDERELVSICARSAILRMGWRRELEVMDYGGVGREKERPSERLRLGERRICPCWGNYCL
ncbi:unnamed protein product [Prunus armeniaca]|uniref:Uncharacterized protein n=1 Tax=Prunus armeniaca TaxID=36596 RepID=A0A6J5VG59_PRUAR|nr:unnamed protein product [Prunus armeniaca]